MKTITLKRSENESIVIQERINPTTGEIYVDFRKWYMKDENGKKQLMPTMKGLLLTAEEFEQLKKAI